MSQPTKIALITVGTITALVAGYAVYFDYRRRNDADFRKSIRKEKKRVQAAEEAERKAVRERTAKELRAALLALEAEGPGPQSLEEQEAYFQEHVSEGEKKAVLGPSMYVESAMHFYRALRFYPQPVELLMIYQKVCPAPVFELIVQVMQLAPGGPTGPSAGNPLGGVPGLSLGGGGGGGFGGSQRQGASVFDIDDEATPSGPATTGASTSTFTGPSGNTIATGTAGFGVDVEDNDNENEEQGSPSGSGVSGASGASGTSAEWERVAGEEA